MAILKDFIDKVTFEEVWELLSPEGGKLRDYEQAYRDIYTGLREAAPAANTTGMVIRIQEEPVSEWSFYLGDEEETDGEEPTIQVSGFVPGDPEGYAIGLKPPEVLVGLEVDRETEETYPAAEIVARCLSEMVYSATMASSAYGTDLDRAGGGLLASQVCMDEDIQNVDLEALREQLGALPKPEEDYKKKYGFLF